MVLPGILLFVIFSRHTNNNFHINVPAFVVHDKCYLVGMSMLKMINGSEHKKKTKL